MSPTEMLKVRDDISPNTRLMRCSCLQACGSENGCWRRECLCENTGELSSWAVCLHVWNQVWVLQMLRSRSETASPSFVRCLYSPPLLSLCGVCKARLNTWLNVLCKNFLWNLLKHKTHQMWVTYYISIHFSNLVKLYGFTIFLIIQYT